LASGNIGGRRNRNGCATWSEDDTVEWRIVGVNLGIVGPGISVREDFMNSIVADTGGVRFGVDLLAGAEWRLGRLIEDACVRIFIVIGKGADIGVAISLCVIDESPEHTAVIGFAAGIDPAGAVHGTVGVFCTKSSSCSRWDRRCRSP